ncbi:MAG: ABC transporter permease [Candidatus Limnocylindrales bacterium]
MLALTIANLRSFVRDRAALFWTLAFPIIFVVLFGTIFSGGGNPEYKIGWVDEDRSAVSGQLRAAFAGPSFLKLSDEPDRATAVEAMKSGGLDAIVVVPAGVGQAVGSAAAAPARLVVITDASQTSTSTAIGQTLAQVVGVVNQTLSGRPPALGIEPQTLQTENLTGTSFFVPSILAMALMQLGVFSAIPLVSLREKLILKRLSATPLRRMTLVGSNVVVRLILGAAQTALILGIGVGLMGVRVIGEPLLIVGLIVLGALTFIALGYVIASFARTEEAANGVTQVVQVPMMFLSGIFFPIALMPEWLRSVAVFMPLTYLGDALRQAMVGGTPFAPIGVDVLVLAGWLVVCLVISARFFRWQ